MCSLVELQEYFVHLGIVPQTCSVYMICSVSVPHLCATLELPVKLNPMLSLR
jgi:hypothetical protein